MCEESNTNLILEMSEPTSNQEQEQPNSIIETERC